MDDLGLEVGKPDDEQKESQSYRDIRSCIKKSFDDKRAATGTLMAKVHCGFDTADLERVKCVKIYPSNFDKHGIESVVAAMNTTKLSQVEEEKIMKRKAGKEEIEYVPLCLDVDPSQIQRVMPTENK